MAETWTPPAPVDGPAEVVAQFWIPGKPVQQGSKDKNRYGQMYESAKGHSQWRRTVADYANVYMLRNRIPQFTQARVWATYVFARPKSHYRTNGEIKPQHVDALHLTFPDLDKLDRCLRDGLTQSRILLDDRVIYGGVSKKMYVTPDVPAPGCLVTIRP